ncbi:MAG: hypothetical protein A2W93_01540 [Bacteroidetes bacterium GWF2_43_63]|nr:MAG: hypothetical protein A2W94_10530 [Bacteroidetes bacterium GWE2_42_42]OFY55751.1 MAG: hypothetical protein A2W93_01540 [Bacteroidetes bacterium GWF2_43_63]HBG71334.1 hypothetical protein [Bacteroidales bacterium]HCB60446.1 hypothetical protein [Bacteroidales bacterium]HCY22597.1 hypothetical protein [Bacteroidales bacterium]
MKLFMFFVAAFATMSSLNLNAQNTYKISLAGQTTDTISRQEIAANPVVAVIGVSQSVELFEVESFEFTYMNSDGDLITIATKSNRLNDGMLSALKNASLKKIYLENVLFTLNGETRPAASARFFLKD